MCKAYSIVICINRRYGINSRSCAASASVELADELERVLGAAGLAIPVKRVKCLGQCKLGPNLRIAPGGRFFHGVVTGDLPEIIAELQRLLEKS